MEDARMTLAGFGTLSLSSRAQYLLTHGGRLKTKVVSSVAFSLYQLEDFFVEVIYNKETNEIESIEGFDDDEHLLDYLDDFHVSKLF